MNENRRRFLSLTGTIGLATFAGCVGNAFGGSDKTPDDTDPSDSANFLGSLSKGGPSEFSNSDDVHSGWVHTVADGETYDVTFDVRICHDSREEVEVELYRRATGEYALSFTTDGGPHGESDCNFGTQINGSGSIPTDFESLSIDANGGNLRTVDREGTFAALHPLPDPIDLRQRS